MNRREFLKSSGLAGLAGLFGISLSKKDAPAEIPFLELKEVTVEPLVEEPVSTFLHGALKYQDPVSCLSTAAPVLKLGDWSRLLHGLSFEPDSGTEYRVNMELWVFGDIPEEINFYSIEALVLQSGIAYEFTLPRPEITVEHHDFHVSHVKIFGITDAIRVKSAAA